MESRDFLNYIQTMMHPRKNMKRFLVVMKQLIGIENQKNRRFLGIGIERFFMKILILENDSSFIQVLAFFLYISLSFTMRKYEKRHFLF